MFETEFDHHSWGWIAMVALVIGLGTALHSTHAQAASVHIFHVQKNLNLSPKDPVYKDYYLSAGQDYGLKEKMILSVVRSTPVFDHSRDLKQGEMKLRMGQLKVIHVGEKMSVARFYQGPDRAELPSPDIEGFMLGDQIDLSDAYMEPAKPAPAEKPSVQASTASAGQHEKTAQSPSANAPLKSSSGKKAKPVAPVAASPGSTQVPIVDEEEADSDEIAEALKPPAEGLESSFTGI